MNLILLVSVAVLSRVQGDIPSRISCISKQCYVAFEDQANFLKALDMCKKTNGHLMTVESVVSEDAIHALLRDMKGEFWIGLRFNDKGCTDPSSTLRRYEWVTGDKQTDFTNWRDNKSLCTPQCVSVSRDLKWTERPCQDNLDGFLCENSVDYVCDPLDSTETGETLEYVTRTGVTGEGAIALPSGSLVTGRPSGNKYICGPPEMGWLRAPWSCEVKNGGCEHECIKNGEPKCACPPGHELLSNNVACASTQNDPCLTMGCEHICMPSEGACHCRAGYELREDGKGCRDIDECSNEIICPNAKCVNTVGSYECHCRDGFEKQNGICVDINECRSSPCEHTCVNTEGSYTCVCFEDYIQRIDDHTKCKLHCGKIECKAQCDINIPTQCECPEGYIKDAPQGKPIVCIDIDECQTNFCSHGCTNTYGSYICSCPLGFKLINGYQCEKYDAEGSGFTTPLLDTVTPTSKDTTDVISAMTPGGLFGIVVCVVLTILIILFLVHQMSKRRLSWKGACAHKNQGEDLQDLQEVTTEKYTKKSSFVNRDLKQDT